MNWLLYLFLGNATAENEAQPKRSEAEANTIGQMIETESSPPETPDKSTSAVSQTQKERLLDDPTNAEQQGDLAEVDSSFIWWVFLGGLAVIGLVATGMRRKNGSLGNIKVITRSYLGREGSLAVVELEDGNLNKRRFLIGLNTNGSPSILADISPVGNFPDLSEHQEPAPPKRLNISIGDPIKKGQDLLSEVLTERAQFESLQSEPAKEKKPKSTPKAKTKTVQVEETEEDPWLKGIEKALGKNG